MRRLFVNVAKSYVGRNVNLHLKDHSVIINVLLTGVKSNKKNSRLRYQTPNGRAEVPIRDVDWVQPLNPLFNTFGGGRA